MVDPSALDVLRSGFVNRDSPFQATPHIYQILSVPEILLDVLRSVPERDEKTLAVAARVNSMWFELATGVLWRCLGDGSRARISALTNISDERRQLYASKLRIAYVDLKPAGIYSWIDQLQFPLLRQLILKSDTHLRSDTFPPTIPFLEPDLSFNYTFSSTIPFLQPRLERIVIDDWGLENATNLLDRITEECPRLSRLHLVLRNGCNIFEHFTGMTRLRSITIHLVGESSMITAESLLALRALPGLDYLEVARAGRMRLPGEKVLYSDIIDDTIESLASALPLLRSLSLDMTGVLSIASLFSLSKHCPLLRVLQLPGRYALLSLDNTDLPLLPNLEKLEIDFADLPERQTAEEAAGLMIRLAPKLERLWIDGDLEWSLSYHDHLHPSPKSSGYHLTDSHNLACQASTCQNSHMTPSRIGRRQKFKDRLFLGMSKMISCGNNS